MQNRSIGLGILAAALAACTTHPTATGTSSPSPTVTASSSSTSPSDSPLPSSVDPYKGWKVYHSSFEGATFRYPPTWVAKITSFNVGGTSKKGEGVELVAPDGFKIAWTSPLSGIGGGCAPTDPHVFIDRILTMPVTGSQHRMYIAVSNVQGRKMVAVVDDRSATPSLKLGDTGDCLYYPTFASESGTGYRLVQFSSGFTPRGSARDRSDRLSVDQYISTPDVRTALLAFRSLHY